MVAGDLVDALGLGHALHESQDEGVLAGESVLVGFALEDDEVAGLLGGVVGLGH